MRSARILTARLALPAMLAASTPLGAQDLAAGFPADAAPRIALWTNHADDTFDRGDPMTVFFSTDVDAYVTVVRINTDGFARVLFPRSPFDDNFARGGEPHAVPGTRGDYTLRIDEYPGEGFLFALVTLDPIAFDVLARDRAWDYVALGMADRVTVDPYLVFADLLDALVPEAYQAYQHVVLPYYVGGGHDYPRFVCYQCHAYVSPAAWDPYAHSCIRVDMSQPAWWRYATGRYGGDVLLPPRTVTVIAGTSRSAPAVAERPARSRPRIPVARRPTDARRPTAARPAATPPARGQPEAKAAPRTARTARAPTARADQSKGSASSRTPPRGKTRTARGRQ